MTIENKLPDSIDINTVDDIDSLINQTNPDRDEGVNQGDPNAGAPIILDFPGSNPEPEKVEGATPTNDSPAGADEEDPLWNSYKEKHPEAAPFKSLEEYVASKTNAPVVPPVESGSFDFEKEVGNVATVQLSPTDKSFAAQKAYELLANKAEVRRLLTEAGLTTVPSTREEWKSVYEADKFTYDNLVAELNAVITNVESQIKTTKRAVELVEQANDKAITDFVGGVEQYVTKINKNIPAELQAEIKTRLEQFFETAKGNAKYYTEKFGVPNFLDAEALKNDFVLANLDIIPKLSSASAPSNPSPAVNSGTGLTAKEELARLAKGTSLNTLGANGVSTPNSKSVNPFDPRQVGGLSEKELDLAIKNLDKQILTS